MLQAKFRKAKAAKKVLAEAIQGSGSAVEFRNKMLEGVKSPTEPYVPLKSFRGFQHGPEGKKRHIRKYLGSTGTESAMLARRSIKALDRNRAIRSLLAARRCTAANIVKLLIGSRAQAVLRVPAAQKRDGRKDYIGVGVGNTGTPRIGTK